MFLIAFDEDRLHPQAAAKLDIGRRVADHHAGRGRDLRESRNRLLEEPRQRLAAVAFARLVRANKKRIDVRALAFEQLLEISRGSPLNPPPCTAPSRCRADSRPPPRANPPHSAGAAPRARRAVRETPPSASRTGAPASSRSECRRGRETPCAGRGSLICGMDHFVIIATCAVPQGCGRGRPHDSRSGDRRYTSRDRDLSHLPGQPGYNTGMDFRTHFERNFGPPQRNAMRQADPPA